MIVRGPSVSSGCGECPFADIHGQPKRPVPGEGNDAPKWIAVGEGPGSAEVRESRPFIGPSGGMVNSALKVIGADRLDGYITNATLCLPSPGATDGMKKKARECCAPRLKDEMAQFPGVPVIALGGVAAQGFIGDKFTITKMAGSCYDADIDGTGERVVIPTIHPAAILRGGAGGGGGSGGAHTVDMLYWNLVYDFAKIVKLGAGADIRFSEDIDIETEDPLRAEQLIEGIVKDIRKARFLAVDTETFTDIPIDGSNQHSALETQHARLSAIGLATQERAVSVIWQIVTPRAKRFITAVLGDSTIRKVMHNRVYDRPVLRRHNMPVRGRNECTLLMHHSAFPGLAHDLQRVGTQFFAIKPWKAEYRDSDDTPIEHCTYNALDTLVTARIVAPLEVCVQRTKGDATYEIDIKMAEIAERMSEIGVPISRAKNTELRERFEVEVIRTRDIVHAKIGDGAIWIEFKRELSQEQAKTKRKKDSDDYEERIEKRLEEQDKLFAKKLKKKGFQLDIDSPVHIGAYLKACGVPLTTETKKGKISTKKDILEGLAHHAIVRGLLDYRECTKMLSTFVRPMPFYMDANDRVHSHWTVNKITGRWGSVMPQLMNWPKANIKKNRPNLRAQVVAPKGRKLVGADFKALEARIIALLSGDPFLLKVFAEERDLHSELARVVWPNFDKLDPKQRKELRDMIKRPEYGAFYGGAIETLWQAVVRDYPTVTRADIGKMVAVMGQQMPRIEVWHQELVRDVVIKKEIRSAIYGRRRAFPLGNADISDIYNFPVQCGKFDQHVLTTSGWVQYQHLKPSEHRLVQHHGSTQNYEVSQRGVQDLFRLRTQGRRATTTANHRFLVYTGHDNVEWRKVRNIHVGDWLAVREASADVDHAPNISGITPQIAEVIGALFGNGSYGGDEVVLSTGDEGYSKYIEKLFGDVFTAPVYRSRAKDRTWKVSVWMKSARAQLEAWGLLRSSRRDKRLPAWCETAPTEIRRALLRGLFDTDGGFGGMTINYSTCVTSAARTVQRLLLAEGIDARLMPFWEETPYGERRPYWRVFLMAHANARFKELVGFRHSARAKILHTRKLPAGRHVLPPGLAAHVGAQIRTRLLGVKKSWTALDHARLVRACRGSLSIEQADRIFTKVEALKVNVDDLRQILTWRFERVVAITRSRRAMTYDIEIFDADHGYVVEGLVTHNSTGADIMDTALLRLKERLPLVDPSAEPILQVHDFVGVECAEELADEVKVCVVEACTQTHSYKGSTVLFAVDADIGDSWAEI